MTFFRAFSFGYYYSLTFINIAWDKLKYSRDKSLQERSDFQEGYHPSEILWSNQTGKSKQSLSKVINSD